MTEKKKESKAMKSWQLLIVGVLGIIIGGIIGGVLGGLITIFLGHLMILFAIVAFIRERIQASKHK